MTQPQSATGLVRDLSDLACAGEVVTLGQVVDTFGARGFGPLIFLPAMIEITPLGAIPGLPSLLALLIGLIAIQIVLGRPGFWLPEALRRRNLEADKVQRAISYLDPAARRMDRWFGRRLQPLTAGLARRVAAMVVIALCLTVPALELIPFASSGPMLAVAVIGLALAAEDGLLMLIGLSLALAALIVAPLMLI
ncbi:exopolysaccharide biosynthesis protein [Roseovarius aestuariivivens]|uniref:exopolysaccharide biosynthesis protein n=1 Tax=Roseovarius aestuariivivens TaxID=1888910 RepID=UPI001081DFBB|nr:exopolysaccharide biosynthesis protein [Roseovarius aestuariivivens]